MSSNPISPDSLRVIAEFGKTTAFAELFDAMEQGFFENWQSSFTPEAREKAWHMGEAALLLKSRIQAITKKLNES